MDFGKWIGLRRQERKLDLQTLAIRSGVDVSTISRVENTRTQVTLVTAIRLCEGLGISVADLLDVVYDKQMLKSEQEFQSLTPAVPTLSDVEQVLSTFHEHEEEGKIWLTDLLNNVVSQSGSIPRGVKQDTFRIFVPEDIQKLLLDFPIYHFEILYPPLITASDIFSIYRRGGMLTLTDIGEYLKKVRRERQVTLEQMEQGVKLSPSILSRLESGITEYIKFSDVLLLDQQLEQRGTLLSMYWETYRCYEHLLRHHALAHGQILKLATLFLIACRWLQVMNPEDVSWMRRVESYQKLV